MSDAVVSSKDVSYIVSDRTFRDYERYVAKIDAYHHFWNSITDIMLNQLKSEGFSFDADIFKILHGPDIIAIHDDYKLVEYVVEINNNEIKKIRIKGPGYPKRPSVLIKKFHCD